MGVQVVIPWEVGKYVKERHGRDVLIVSRKDWNRVRKVVKRYPEVNRELKALDIVLSPVMLRGGDDVPAVVVKRGLARKESQTDGWVKVLRS